MNAVRDSLDEDRLNDYFKRHRDAVQAFEARYGIEVPLPLDAEGLVRLIQQVVEMQALSDGGEGS